jgi:hypothetical protein
MATTRAAGVTAAAGTGLAQLLFLKLFTLQKSHPVKSGTWVSPVAIARIAEVSRLLRPVGPGTLSQVPSPGSCSHNPYRLLAWWAFTPPTT